MSIPPLIGLVQALAPADAEVTCALRTGQSVHHQELTPADINRLSRADVVVFIGLGLDSTIEKFVHDNAQGAGALSMADGLGMVTQESDHNHDHDHSGPNPHLWLDPVLVRQWVPDLAAAIKHASEQSGYYADDQIRNVDVSMERLLERIDELDEEHQRRLGPFARRAIVTHHAAFERLAERYGLRVAAVLAPIESAEPTPGQIAEAMRVIREQGAGAIFVEPQFNPAAARRVAKATGARLGTLDPLGNEDWFGLMRANLEVLTDVLSDDPE